MAILHNIKVFARASFLHQRIALEAMFELTRARMDTLRPAERYTRHLGQMDGTPPPADAQQQARARRIGRIVERVAPFMPFRALCLQQALAVRRMLDRRGLPATVYLGLSHEPVGGKRAAHAWVKSGERVVNGDVNLDRFAVVGVFA